MSKKAAITKTQAAIIATIVVIAGVVGVAYYFLSTAPPPRDKITVGWVHGISGYLAPQTATLHIYYKWIIEDYNAMGGLYVPEYGRRFNITYIEYDDESDINKMMTYTEKLITEDKVDLLFAPCSTAFAFAAMPLYEKYKMPVIAVSFGSDIAGEKMKTGEWQYSMSVLGFPGETGAQVVELFKYINSTNHPTPGNLQSVGIIFHSDQHGVEYAAGIGNYLLMNGFSVPVYESYLPTIPSFVPLINKLKAANVDVVMLCGYEGNTFIRACQSQHYNPKSFWFGPIMETPFLVFTVFNFTQAEVNGTCYYDGWPSTAYKSGELADWAAAHATRTALTGPPMLPYPASATFYSALQCLFKAVEKVGLDHTKIKDSLHTDSFETLVGTTHIRPGYSMTCSLAGTLTQWQNRQMMEVIWPLSVASANVTYPRPANW
jgi:branched-chain amino acid transport system substrate-binding protein